LILTGHWYPASSARRQGAELRLDEDGFQLFPDGETTAPERWRRAAVQPPNRQYPLEYPVA